MKMENRKFSIFISSTTISKRLAPRLINKSSFSHDVRQAKLFSRQSACQLTVCYLLGTMQNSPIFSTSQGNVKVSPTTALYVCPCVINLACVVDDVVASDLLPNGNKEEKGKWMQGNLNRYGFIDELWVVVGTQRKLQFLVMWDSREILFILFAHMEI